MIDLEEVEAKKTFQQINTSHEGSQKAIMGVIEEFGDQIFTRSHVETVIIDQKLIPDYKDISEIVRYWCRTLVKRHYIKKTGERKFGRDCYQRAK